MSTSENPTWPRQTRCVPGLCTPYPSPRAPLASPRGAQQCWLPPRCGQGAGVSPPAPLGHRTPEPDLCGRQHTAADERPEAGHGGRADGGGRPPRSPLQVGGHDVL